MDKYIKIESNYAKLGKKSYSRWLSNTLLSLQLFSHRSQVADKLGLKRIL